MSTETEVKQNRIYIGNIQNRSAVKQIEEECKKLGNLTDLWVSHKLPGFAFMQFEIEDAAKLAVEQLNEKRIEGANVRVELSTKKDKPANEKSDRGSKFVRNRPNKRPSTPFNKRPFDRPNGNYPKRPRDQFYEEDYPMPPAFPSYDYNRPPSYFDEMEYRDRFPVKRQRFDYDMSPSPFPDPRMRMPYRGPAPSRFYPEPPSRSLLPLPPQGNRNYQMNNPYMFNEFATRRSPPPI